MRDGTLWTQRDVERYLHCGRSVIDRLVRQGRLHPTDLNQGGTLRRLRFDPEEVRKFAGVHTPDGEEAPTVTPP